MIADRLTVVIVARDAAATIARAVESVVGSRILLLDDGSTDDTGGVARQAAGDGIEIVVNRDNRGLGHARQLAVANVRTPYLVWLDADDGFEPDRISTLWRAAESGADLVFDEAALFDGTTGRFLRRVHLPEFVLAPGGIVRSFERNYLPGSAWPLARTAFVRRVGFDSGQASAEDLDFLLRAIVLDARVELVRNCGYRQYAYPSSLSRDLSSHMRFVARALRKHDYEDVRHRFLDAGYCPRVAAWGLCSMAVFREEFEAALGFLAEACPDGFAPSEILEPDGPLPVPEGWRHGFMRGTLLCVLQRWSEALPCFAQASEFSTGSSLGGGAPDLLNNWSVALARNGSLVDARPKFEAALTLFHEYVDAQRNLVAPVPSWLTLHPLRRLPSRREY